MVPYADCGDRVRQTTVSRGREGPPTRRATASRRGVQGQGRLGVGLAGEGAACRWGPRQPAERLYAIPAVPASATHQTCGKLAGKTRQNVRALARASRRGEAFNPHVHSNLIINWNCFQLLITSWLIILEHADVTRHVQTDALVSGLNMSMIKLHVTCTRERYGEFMVCWYHRESGPP